MTKRIISLLAGGACIASLAGCDTVVRQGVAAEAVDQGYKVDASLMRFGEREALRAGGTQVSDGIFMGATRERGGAATMLPPRLQGAAAVTLNSSQPMSLPQIALRLSEITGVQHVVSLGPTGVIVQAAAAPAASAMDVSAMPVPSDGATPAPVGAAAAGNYVSSGMPADSAVAGRTMIPRLRGPLSNVLAEISAVFGVDWAYEDGRIVFRDFVTRQYQISALPTANTSSSSIGGSGAGSSGSSLTSSSSTSIDIWSDVRSSIAGLIGKGANISLSPSTGMVTVTATVADQMRVSDYIRDVNQSTGQQITFDVNILRVTLNQGSSHGIDLEGVFSGSGANLGGSTSNSLDSRGGSLNFGIVSGDFNLSAVVRALSQDGRVAVAQRTGATTSNNRMAPINVVDTVSYVSGQECETTDSGNRTCTPEIDTADVGFQIQLLPRVLNNREIMLQYAVRISDLTSLTSVPSGDGGVTQLPQISETSMQQESVLMNGQTLVMAGFERDTVSVEDSGASRRLFGIGGKKEASKERVATVIMIKPRLIDRAGAVRR